MAITWAEYARTFSQCFVEHYRRRDERLGVQGNTRWTVHLPDDTVFEHDDLEIIRAKAAEYGCTITF
jgi:hypothetical protein